MPPELHHDLEALAPLLGEWVGRGSGEYPTIEPFDYLEEVDIHSCRQTVPDIRAEN